MNIRLPCNLGDGKEYDDHQFTIESVTWDQGKQHFLCDSSEQLDMHMPRDVADMVNFYQQAGFQVHRSSLYAGRR